MTEFMREMLRMEGRERIDSKLSDHFGMYISGKDMRLDIETMMYRHDSIKHVFCSKDFMHGIIDQSVVEAKESIKRCQVKPAILDTDSSPQRELQIYLLIGNYLHKKANDWLCESITTMEKPNWVKRKFIKAFTTVK